MLGRAFIPVVKGGIRVWRGGDAIGDTLDPKLRLGLGAFDFGSCTLDEGTNGGARVVAVFDETPPGVVIKNEEAALIEHLPAHDCIMQDIDSDVGCVDVDEIEATTLLPEGDKSIVASGLHDSQLGDLGAFGDVGVEAMLQSGELIAIGGMIWTNFCLMFHAAFKGINDSHDGVGMAHEIVQNPGSRATLETANLEDTKLAAAEVSGTLLPFGADQFEPVLLEVEAGSVVIGRHVEWMCDVG